LQRRSEPRMILGRPAKMLGQFNVFYTRKELADHIRSEAGDCMESELLRNALT